MNRQATLDLLRRHDSAFEEERDFLAQTMRFVEQHPEFWQRSTLAGHLTGSAWILSPERDAALLIHHQKLDTWFQPGGHADDTDADLCATALREATEECGGVELVLVSPAIFDLDIHPIPARGDVPAHLHYDVRFLFWQKNATTLTHNPLEIKDLRWVSLAELVQPEVSQSLRRMALKSQAMG
jgi:8-oxo-dGTP pyrophosphatase MutT (NUDIX family)